MELDLSVAVPTDIVYSQLYPHNGTSKFITVLNYKVLQLFTYSSSKTSAIIKVLNTLYFLCLLGMDGANRNVT